MNTSTRDLIAQIREQHPESNVLQEELISRGSSVIAEIVDEAQQHISLPPWMLLATITLTATQDSIDYLISIVREGSRVAANTACIALGHIGEKRAAVPIAHRLLNEARGPIAAEPTANALIMLADEEASALLRDQASKWLSCRKTTSLDWLKMLTVKNGFDLLWPMMIASAITATGDYTFAPLALDIASLPKDAFPSTASLHASFCDALRHFSCPGILHAIRAAAKAGGHGSKQILSRILGLIGTRDAIEVLIDFSKIKHPETSCDAAAWFSFITGAELDDAELYGELTANWWQENADKFDHGTCYCHGAPWRPDVLFDRLGPPGTATDNDLLTVTGLNILSTMRKTRKTREDAIQDLRVQAAATFGIGKLYRHGHELDTRMMSAAT